MCAGRHAPDQRSAAHQRRSPSGLSLVMRGSHQRKPTSANHQVVCRWSCALHVHWSSSACALFSYALVVRLTSSASSPVHSAIFASEIRLLRSQANWTRFTYTGIR
ncbi:hypothetical protein Q3G72_031584 [Acer saccharum]|nr:hypothetical protein Q3G72_031584 [Acer saccharum]